MTASLQNTFLTSLTDSQSVLSRSKGIWSGKSYLFYKLLLTIMSVTQNVFIIPVLIFPVTDICQIDYGKISFEIFD